MILRFTDMVQSNRSTEFHWLEVIFTAQATH